MDPAPSGAGCSFSQFTFSLHNDDLNIVALATSANPNVATSSDNVEPIISISKVSDVKKIRKELFHNRTLVTVLPYHSIHSIDNDNAFWITNALFRCLGRSTSGLTREDYLHLLSITRTECSSDWVYSTPLHIAVKTANLEDLEELLKGTEVEKDCVNRFGETAVLVALKNMDYDLVEMLLKYDCDCTTESVEGLTPLHLAALDNSIEMMGRFIDKGADVNASNKIGITPLHLAVLASKYEAVQELLKYDANPSMFTILELTPLMLALGFKGIDIRICELLCDYDMHTGTRLGNPVYFAVTSHHSLAKKLISSSTDVNFIVDLYTRKSSCLTETLANKDLFDVIWPKVDHNILREQMVDFLNYNVLGKIYLSGKAHFLNVILKICSSPYAPLIFKALYKNLTVDTDRSFLGLLSSEYPMGDELSDIVLALPIAYWRDVLSVYDKFKFEKELYALLKVYEYTPPMINESMACNIHASYICFNANHAIHNFLLPKELLHFLKFYTPTRHFRETYKFVRAKSVHPRPDTEASALCEAKMAAYTVPSLVELARNRLRHRLFILYRQPYNIIYKLPIPNVIKDILLLKKPLYR